MTRSQEPAVDGSQIKSITESSFLDFARRHGSSEEIGRISTYLDNAIEDRVYGEPYLLAIFGCGDICAVSCCTLIVNRSGKGYSCKLDSIIVHPSIRRGGLGAMLVNKAFQELMDDERFDITCFLSYAVHPATVSMLRRLGFSKPPPSGAPLSSLNISDANRKEFMKKLKIKFERARTKFEFKCISCRKRDKRTRPWCVHSPL